jgi:cellulose synthase/poly-beta-1,6-N-acetylglucosamine synthase-like glycosyltransferase
VFVTLCALGLYTVAGYPLLLGWMAGRWPRPVKKRDLLPALSFVIPVHNGANYLAAKLESILALDYPRDLFEVLVVSDGSTDATDEIARGFAARGVQLLRLPKGGKPAALNAAVPQTHNEILVLTDVRQLLAPESVRKLVSNFADERVGVVSGDLLIRQGNLEESSIGAYWRYERWIRTQLGRLDSTMGATGPFYAMRRTLFRQMPNDLLLDDMYLPMGAFNAGYRLIVEPEAQAFDFPTNVNIEFRRKVRTLAGNYQLLRYYPWLLTPRNRMLFHYVSYKLLRLMLPWIALGLLIASFGLPEPWRTSMIAAQLGIYALAALDAVSPSAAPWRRVTAPLRTIVSMLLAAACAVSILFVKPQKLWTPTQIPLKPKT